MLVFPQLTTGAIAQYPLARKRRTIAVTNLLIDGSTVSYSDQTPDTNNWDLTLRDLTDAEADSIQALFQAVEGRLGTFTFLDPTANLLAHSEELDSSCWQNSPMLQITTGIDDPVGGSAGIRLINAGQTAQSFSQMLGAPAWFSYSFSTYARSVGGSTFTLTRSASSSSNTRLFQPGSGWTRCVMSGDMNATDESVRFSLGLPPGASVDLYGIQVESQPSPSAYKRTGTRNGVYSNARFDDDVLRIISDGPDQNRLNLRVVSKD